MRRVPRCSGRLDAGASEDDGDNQSVETESLSENKDENHADVDVLLGVGAYTSITYNTNAETGAEGGKAAAESASQVLVAVEVGVLLVEFSTNWRGLSDHNYIQTDGNECPVSI